MLRQRSAFAIRLRFLFRHTKSQRGQFARSRASEPLRPRTLDESVSRASLGVSEGNPEEIGPVPPAVCSPREAATLLEPKSLP